MADQPADTPVLYGLRCVEPNHIGFGYQRVYCRSRNPDRYARLADVVACYQPVISVDGGQTWVRADT